MARVNSLRADAPKNEQNEEKKGREHIQHTLHRCIMLERMGKEKGREKNTPRASSKKRMATKTVLNIYNLCVITNDGFLI